MKTFKVILTVILALAGLVCFCIGRIVIGVILFAIAIALWMPRGNGPMTYRW